MLFVLFFFSFVRVILEAINIFYRITFLTNLDSRSKYIRHFFFTCCFNSIIEINRGAIILSIIESLIIIQL